LFEYAAEERSYAFVLDAVFRRVHGGILTTLNGRGCFWAEILKLILEGWHKKHAVQIRIFV
jgi:hypothetical protein